MRWTWLYGALGGQEIAERDQQIARLQTELDSLKNPSPRPPGVRFKCPECKSDRCWTMKPIISVEIYPDQGPVPIAKGVTVQCIGCLGVFHVEHEIEAAKTTAPRKRGDKEDRQPVPPDSDLKFSGRREPR